MPAATLLFDGDCGFCTWIVGHVQRYLRPRARVIPWQFADLTALHVTATQCAEALQWVDADGTVASGGRAVSALLRHSRRPWPVLGAITAAPGVAVAVDVLYRAVARNRYRLPGSTPACALGPPDRAAA